MGITGSAIPIDLLKIEHPASSNHPGFSSTHPQDNKTNSRFRASPSCWIRIPSQDLSIVTAALTAWSHDLNPPPPSLSSGFSAPGGHGRGGASNAIGRSGGGAAERGRGRGRGQGRGGNRITAGPGTTSSAGAIIVTGAAAEPEGQRIAWRIRGEGRWLGPLVLQSSSSGSSSVYMGGDGGGGGEVGYGGEEEVWAY